METNGYIKSGAEQTAHRRSRKRYRDLLGVYGDPEWAGAVGDEALVHILPVQVGLAKRVTVVGPVDMATVHRHRAGEGAAGDKAYIHVLPVQLRPANPVIDVRPVNVATVHRQPV